MTAWDYWFDLGEADMEARGAHGPTPEEVSSATESAFVAGKKRRARNGKPFLMAQVRYWADYRDSRIKAGKCRVHNAPLVPGKRSCAKCIAYQRAYKAQQRAAKGATSGPRSSSASNTERGQQ